MQHQICRGCEWVATCTKRQRCIPITPQPEPVAEPEFCTWAEFGDWLDSIATAARKAAPYVAIAAVSLIALAAAVASALQH